jgi:hypothetical protein
MNTTLLLADAVTVVDEKINKIGPYLTDLPTWAFQAILCCSVASLILTVYIFLRQKKIAQNQVDLGKILEQLIQK